MKRGGSPASTVGYRESGVLPAIAACQHEAIALRRRIHRHPEMADQEHRTGALVAERLAEWGDQVHTGLAGTGVLGVLRRGGGARRLGLRADMDALPIQETTGLPWASQVPGTMHACGHDGHTAPLLAAARCLATDDSLDDTLHLIFQPAEEGPGGARRMIEDGLFEGFPCDAVFAMHNMPGASAGQFVFREGVFMASSDTVILRVKGVGGRGSMPHLAVDPVGAAAQVILALQTIMSRNVDPREMAVITVGAIHGGEAPNVIPDQVEMRATTRAYTPAMRAYRRERITEVARRPAETLGVTVEVDYHWRYPALVNDAACTEFARAVARECLGEAAWVPDVQPITGSEDFAFMPERCLGAYFMVGNGTGAHHSTGGCMVHNPGDDFNDAILPVAASYGVHLARRFLRTPG